MGNGKGVVLPLLARTCDLLANSCGPAELSRRNTDEALESVGELALVREAGVCGDLRQGEVAFLQKYLSPLDAAQDDVLVRGQPGGHLKLPCEMVGAEVGDLPQLRQAWAGIEVLLDVLDDGAEFTLRERA